jgi:DNA polymerase-3 subunit alpha
VPRRSHQLRQRILWSPVFPRSPSELALRAVIKDVGRALDMPYARLRRLPLVLPLVRGRNVSIEDAFSRVPSRSLIETDAR